MGWWHWRGMGNAEAQYHVGMMLIDGIGTEQDPRTALNGFKAAHATTRYEALHARLLL